MPMGRIFRGGQSRGRGLNFKQVKQVQKIIEKNKRLKVEFKNQVDVMTSVGALNELTTVAEGDDFNERQGDIINAMSLKVQWTVSPNATPTAGVYRIMIVRARIGALVAADLPAVVGTPDLDKFQVLYDKVYNVNASATYMNFGETYFKSFKNRKVPYMKVRYDDDISASAAQDNAIYLWTISGILIEGPSFQAFTRLKFFDTT